MVTVHAHAFWGAGVPEDLVGSDFVANVLTPPVLEEAVDVLRCDRGARAGSRRRRAIAELAAYGELGVRFREVLARVGVDVDCLKAGLGAQPTAHGAEQPADLFVSVVNALPDMVPELLPETSAVGYGEAPTEIDCQQNVGKCPWTALALSKPVIGSSSPIVMRARFRIPTSEVPFARARENLDPQRWDDCSDFWHPPPDATHLVASVVNNTPVPLCPTPEPGSGYGLTKLYEFFRCDQIKCIACCAWFEIVLNVETKRDDRNLRYEVGYSLPRDGWLAGEVYGAPTSVISDHGWIKVHEDSGYVVVESEKNVKFDRNSANAIAQWALLFTEFNQQLAEVTCCLK